MKPLSRAPKPDGRCTSGWAIGERCNKPLIFEDMPGGEPLELCPICDEATIVQLYRNAA